MKEITFTENGYKLIDAMEQRWYEAQYSFETTPRPLWGIMLMLSGSIKFDCSQPFLAKEGDLVLLPKGARYKASMKKGRELTRDLLINFDADIDVDSACFPQIIMQSTPIKVFELMSKIVRDKQFGVVSKLRITSDFYALLDEINGTEKQDDSFVEKAMNLIAQNPYYKIAQVAKECGVCESGLRGAFKKKIGMSPAKFRVITKINRAKYLLQTGCSVKEISNELKFYDEAYFCKTFKEITGFSPKQYKSLMRL